METDNIWNTGENKNPFGQTFGGSDLPPPKRSLSPDALRLYHGFQRFLNRPSSSSPTLASYRAASGSSHMVNQNLSRELTRQASPGLSPVIDNTAFSPKIAPPVSNSTTFSTIRGTETFSPQRKGSSFGRDNTAFKPASASSDTFPTTDPRHTDAIPYGSDTSSGASSRLRSQGDTPDYAPAAGNEGFHLPDEIHPGLVSPDSPGQQERTRQKASKRQAHGRLGWMPNERATQPPMTTRQDTSTGWPGAAMAQASPICPIP